MANSARSVAQLGPLYILTEPSSISSPGREPLKVIDNLADKLRFNLDQPTIDYQGLGKIFHQIGHDFNHGGNVEKAVESWSTALLYFKQMEGDHHQVVVNQLILLVDGYKSLNRPDRALRCLTEIEQIKKDTLGEDHTDLAFVYDQYGLCHQALGDHKKAVSFLQKAADIKRTIADLDPLNLASTLINLVVAKAALSDFRTAITDLNKVLETRKSILGENHPEVADVYNNLGATYFFLDNSEKAIYNLRRANAILKQTLPPNHPEIAKTEKNLATAYYKSGHFDHSLTHWTHVLSYRNRTFGSTSLPIAETLNEMGRCYFAQKDYAQAFGMFSKTFEICEALGQKDHPSANSAKQNMAWAIEKGGQSLLNGDSQTKRPLDEANQEGPRKKSK